jgi:16S rRNA processing protein RimM
MASETVTLGKVGAPYGVKGWFKVTSYTEELDGIFDYSPWLLLQGGEVKEYTVEHWKHHNKSLVAKLEGVDDRDAAEAIKNLEISVDSAVLPQLDEDEFYWRELIGMTVVNTKGYDFGKIEQMFETGANDVMVVKANVKDAFGQKQRMIPYLYEQVVLDVDREARTVTVDWDPGF